MKACLHFLLLELNLELDVVMGDVVCCLEKNLSISKTCLFKLSAGAYSNASSAHVRSQAGPEMTQEQQLYLLDAEVSIYDSRSYIKWSNANYLSSVFICMYDTF